MMMSNNILLPFLCVMGLSNIAPLAAAAAISTRATAVMVSRNFSLDNPYLNWPSYADLPLDPSYPTKAAWGVWGADDTFGALNHITPDTVKAASSEIQIGQTFNLNLELSFIPRPIAERRKPSIHLINPNPGYIDDYVTLNTQATTQIDGLRHFPYSEPVEDISRTYRFYNDKITNFEDIIGDNITEVLGIQQVAEKGIAVRAVLLDYKAWRDSRNETFDPLSRHVVNSSDLDAVARWQGLPSNWTRPGDVLLIRFGWTEAFARLNETQRQAVVLGPGTHIGVPATDDTAEWLWNKKLAMVGGDNPAFEALPITMENVDGQLKNLHEVMISGWGQSILESLDLERLAPALRSVRRSHFFMTIQALNVRGGIASPANAMAII